MILILFPPQGFFSRETDFHLRQFFSNFLRYSFPNFPLSQPYSNFAIYLLGSSICLSFFILGFHFPTLSCLLTSVLIFSSNLSTVSLVFTKSFSFSHVSYSAINPFHYTRYFSVSLTFLLFNILSTSHSSSPSTSIDLTSSFFWSLTCSLYHIIWLTFTTRWILIEIGSHNLTTLVDTTSSIVYGLMY